MRFPKSRRRCPDDVGDRLTKLGKEIGDLVAQAVRGGSREARSEMRERVRQAAREMRDKIREAARDVRNRSHDQAARQHYSVEYSIDYSVED